MDWRDPVWLDGALAWIRANVPGTPAGSFEQRHVYPWATVLRVPSSDGVLWFKANAPIQRFGSLLLMPLLRFLPKDDDRIRATVLAIADELTLDGLVLRYRVEQTDDGLSGEEGTFTICSFWLVSALVEIGELRRARELCEKLLSFASPLQLYAEEIDAITGRHLGNFPQAFTHLAQINAVVHLIQAELREKRGFSMAHQIVT